MKKISIIVFLVFISGFCFGQDIAEGFWINVDTQGNATEGWEVYAVNRILYAKILSLTDHPQDIKATKCTGNYPNFPIPGNVNEMAVVGTPWIFGLTQDKPGIWSGGNIVDPLNGRMYRCRITFHPQDNRSYNTDTLQVRGEIAFFGLSQYWRKSTREEASSLR